MAKYWMIVLLAGSCLFSSNVAAMPPSETLLPNTTKGFLSLPDLDELTAKWQQTQLGQLVDDPVMKPFIDDLKKQIRNKLTKTRVRLGLSLEDLQGVYGGEICLATIQPGGDEKKHALVLLVDITDHQQEAAKMLEKSAGNLVQQGAKKRTETIGGVQCTIFTMPAKRPDQPILESLYIVYQDVLIATDSREVAKGIVGQLGGVASPTLDGIEAFQATMARCQREAGEMKPHVRWFVEPFGYARVARAAAGGRKRRGVDMLKILGNQGFKAVKGVGGLVYLATGEQEILHRTLVYAPPVKHEAGSSSKARYELAARMLDFPNTDRLQPQDWVFRDLGTYFTFNWKMADAFEYSKTMVNEMIGSLAEDKDGPRIDLRKDLIQHFADRVSIIVDCRRPITPDSERRMFAIELANPKAVREAVNRAMENDPDAKKRVFGRHIIWEILTDDGVADVETLQIEGGGFDPFAPEEDVPTEEARDRVLPNSAITVANGHLIIASHVDVIVEMLQRPIGVDNLSQAVDFQTVEDALRKLGAGEDSFRFFTRTDEAYRTTYELIHQGKMPQAKSLLGKLLNRMLGPDEEGILREQQIDGAKMPEYDAVRRYLGPAGVYVRSEEDGWFVTGCLLDKEMQ